MVAKMEANEIRPAPVWTNLKTFPFRKFRGCVDILSGGFPCQPFSVCNSSRKKSTEDPRHLFPYILEGIKPCSPRLVFLENVEGIISSKTGDGESVLQYVLRSLEEVGYRSTAGIFSAVEVNAPHQRKRVFIMGRIGAEGREEEGETEYDLRGETTGCSGDLRGNRWPSRPGEPQHDWEEPRVVGDPASTGLQEREASEQQQPVPPTEHSDREQEPGETLPELGGANDGTAGGVDATANRVDRLRLLGNGVVPATAELAFTTLFNRLFPQGEQD